MAAHGKKDDSQVDPLLAEIICNRGCDWHEIGEFDKAIVEYSKAIRLNPESVNAFSTEEYHGQKRESTTKQ